LRFLAVGGVFFCLAWLRPAFATTKGLSQIVTPDVALVATAESAGLSALLVEPLSAGAVARLGWGKLRQGQAVSPEQLDANYIRRSDAEIFGAKG